MIKPDCYSCKYSEKLSYSCHLQCNHPFVKNENMIYALLNTMGKLTYNPLNIKLNSHGVKNGWATFPIDFDPIWLENCDGFEQVGSGPKNSE